MEQPVLDAPDQDTAQVLAAGAEVQAGFVYNPWKMKEIRRLYVSLQDGTKVGYLDLSTMDSVPESAHTQDLLHQALAALSPAASPLAAPAEHPGPAAQPLVADPADSMPWTDLAANCPGELISGFDDTHYRAGLAGEQRTAGVLAPLERSGYRVLHSLPLSPRKDIDHLVIGPTGLWMINTKATSYAVTVRGDGSVHADGYRQTWVESLARDAGIASERLSAAARMDLQCRPLVVVWSTQGVAGASGSLSAGAGLAAQISAPAPLFSAAWVDVVYNTARRSDTWTAHH